MLAAQFFVWWYGEGWRSQARAGQRRLTRTARTFSAPLLLRTLFAPWRRVVTDPGAGLDAKLRAMGDNLVSRAVGFTVRIFVLLTAGIMLFVMSVVAIVELVAWPFVPLAIVFGIVRGLL
jgi:hypothetical protein